MFSVISAACGVRGCRPAAPVLRQSVRTYRNIVKLFSERGLLQDAFPKPKVNDLINLLEKKSVGVYAGFDPTADSLHIGNLVVLMGLLHAQRSGHQPIAVIGGATGRIGDPSGKSTERPVLATHILDQNILGVTEDINKIFNNHNKFLWNSDNHKPLLPVKVINNEDFYKDMNIVDFVSNVGRHFRMGSMLGRHSVKSRIQEEEGMSFTEFTYQTFQAYDWLRLCKDHDCHIQLGGSDQMGNIVSGQDLISRCLDKRVYGLTVPLVVSESGSKFGKSAGTPVWISEYKTTPFQVYQYMMRQADADVERMLKLFTFKPLPEIQAILSKHEAKPDLRYGQERLAEEVTLLLHGDRGVDLAVKSTNILYKNDIRSLSSLSVVESRTLFEQADYLQKLFTPGTTMLEFAMSIGCFKTERDAVRIINAGGFYVNQARMANTEEVVVPGLHILENNLTLVRVGKKNYYLIEWVTS